MVRTDVKTTDCQFARNVMKLKNVFRNGVLRFGILWSIAWSNSVNGSLRRTSSAMLKKPAKKIAADARPIVRTRPVDFSMENLAVNHSPFPCAIKYLLLLRILVFC